MKKKISIPYGKQTIDEDDIKAVVQTVRSDFLTQGPAVERFEESVSKYCGAQYAVAFSSGTAALHGACFAAGIQKGDEVITTPMTFAASANCVLYCGGKPVFADIQKNIPLIDPREIEKKITKKTKALIPVDYSGVPCDYHEMNRIAKKNRLIVIADSAHSFGALYHNKEVGTLADMTMLSFHPVKLITTGEGGMIVTNNKYFFERLKLFRTHGITKEKRFLNNKKEGNWYYEMQELGFNYRMTDFQAALGFSQLKKANRFINRRNEIAQLYLELFKKTDFVAPLVVPKNRTSAWHLFPVRLNLEMLNVSRKKIFEELHTQGIKVQVHYIPVHLHPYYREKFNCSKGDFPHAEEFYDCEISLPMYPNLTDKAVQMIANCLQIICYKRAKPLLLK